MQTNIFWEGTEYNSSETCLVNENNKGLEVASTIIGLYEGETYKVDYLIKTNSYYETTYFEIHSKRSNHIAHIVFESDGKAVGHKTAVKQMPSRAV